MNGDHMKTCISFALLLLAVGSANAQQSPTKAQARQVWEKIEAVLPQTGGWEKLAPAERQKRLDVALEVNARASQLWRGPSACKFAASSMVDYVRTLNGFALVIEGKRGLDTPADLYAPMFKAVQFGEHRAACQEEVAGLK